MLKKFFFIFLLFVTPNLSAMEVDLTNLEKETNKQIGFKSGSDELHPQTPIFNKMKQGGLTGDDLTCVKETDTFVTFLYWFLFINQIHKTSLDFCTSQHLLLNQKLKSYYLQAPETMYPAAIFIAAARNLLIVIQYIISTKNINPTEIRDQFNQTLLQVAKNNKSNAVIEYLRTHYGWN